VPVPDDTSPVVIPVAGELPFLVTHWLAGFKGDGCNDDDNNPQTAAALEKIHGAAADLAKAFASLGTFGRRSIMVSKHVEHTSLFLL
jgi:hypothetical protein